MGQSHIGGEYLDSVPDPDWKIVGTADFNSDGKPDILWRHTSGDNYVWYMNGAITIGGEYLRQRPDPDWIIAGMGDFNSDGKPDILWRHHER